MTLYRNKNSGILLIAILFLSSCATILNSPVQKIYISSDKNVKIISVDKATYVDSSFIYRNAPKAYYVPRSDQPLKVTVQIDSIQKIILLNPRNSLAYWANIYFNYGIGMLVDMDNVKRYGYKIHNYFTAENATTITNNSTIKQFRFNSSEKGQLNLSLSLPFMTNLVVNTTDKHYESSGMLGLEAGLNYYYSTKSFLSANIGIGADKLLVEYFGPHQESKVVYASFRNNRVLGSFDIGYGINISKYFWDITMTSGQNAEAVGLGGSFSADYRLGNYLKLGVLYQPNLLNTSFKPTIDYQHFFSLNGTFTLPINRKNK